MRVNDLSGRRGRQAGEGGKRGEGGGGVWGVERLEKDVKLDLQKTLCVLWVLVWVCVTRISCGNARKALCPDTRPYQGSQQGVRVPYRYPQSVNTP